MTVRVQYKEPLPAIAEQLLIKIAVGLIIEQIIELTEYQSNEVNFLLPKRQHREEPAALLKVAIAAAPSLPVVAAPLPQMLLPVSPHQVLPG